MYRFSIVFFILVAFSSVSAEFGKLASLDGKKIEEQARNFIALKYPEINPNKLVLFGVRLNYSKLINGDSILQATFINLAPEVTGKPIERVMPSPENSSISIKVIFTEYQSVELTFNKMGKVVSSTKRLEMYPDPPEVFKAVVSEL